MTREEFVKQRCEIDKITEEEFEKKYRVVKCYCGQPYCKGYRCLDLDDLLRENQELKEKLDKYENPEDMTLMVMWCTEKVKEENQKLQTIANNCKQLKNNWNKLRKYFNERIEVCDNRLSSPFCNFEKETKERLIFSQCLEKLEELEESDINDSN